MSHDVGGGDCRRDKAISVLLRHGADAEQLYNGMNAKEYAKALDYEDTISTINYVQSELSGKNNKRRSGTLVGVKTTPGYGTGTLRHRAPSKVMVSACCVCDVMRRLMSKKPRVTLLIHHAIQCRMIIKRIF